MQDRIATAEARKDLTDRAVALQQAVATKTAGRPRGDMEEVLGMNEEQFRTWMASPANQEKFNQMVENTVRANREALGVDELLTAYGAARGLAGGQPFSRTNHLMSVPDQPYSFKSDGAAYLQGGNVDKKQQELQRVAHRTRVPGFGSLAELEHDDDFKEALRTAQSMRVISDQLKEFPVEERPSYLRELVRNDENVAQMTDDQKRLLSQPEKVDQMVEDINRAWALRKLIGPAPKLTTSTGRLEPTGATVATPRPTPAQRAVESVTTPESTRRQARIYSAALGVYSESIPDPDIAEQFKDIADAFDNARHSPQDSLERDFRAANAAFMELTRDYPEYKDRAERAIMRGFEQER
jgi:hypothetical protein